MVSPWLRRALGEIGGAGENFAGGGLERSRGAAERRHRRGQPLADGVEVVAELAEGALELALHALGEIGVGERGQDVAGLAEIALDRLDEVVDAGAEAVELGVVEAEADALGEVAGDGGIDHLAERALQGLHHLDALGGAEFLVHALFVGHLADADGVLAEDLDRTGHGAELVAAAGLLDLDFEVAVGKLAHGARQAGHGLGDGARKEPADDGGGERARPAPMRKDHGCRDG